MREYLRGLSSHHIPSINRYSDIQFMIFKLFTQGPTYTFCKLPGKLLEEVVVFVVELVLVLLVLDVLLIVVVALVDLR